MAIGATIITFVVYLVFLMAVGLYFYKKTNNIEDYLLGGRGMGKWVTALSAQASDMSGWLLMGLPGAVYLYGINQSWIAIGLFIGTVVNWLVVAPRLRTYTEKNFFSYNLFIPRKSLQRPNRPIANNQCYHHPSLLCNLCF